MIKSHRSDSPGDHPGVGRCVRSATGLLGLAAAVLLLASPPARADIAWTLSGTGDWSTGSNWNGGVPTVSSTADIFNGGTVTVTLTGEACNTLSIGGSKGGTLDVYGGGLTVGSTLSVGNSGTATLSMTAGTVVVSGSEYVGNGSSGIGTVTVSGGTTTVGSLLDIGLGTAEHRDLYPLGRLVVRCRQRVRRRRRPWELQPKRRDPNHHRHPQRQSWRRRHRDYTLSAGSLSVTGSEYLGDGGAATFLQTGGTNAVAGTLYLGSGTPAAGPTPSRPARCP